MHGACAQRCVCALNGVCAGGGEGLCLASGVCTKGLVRGRCATACAGGGVGGARNGVVHGDGGGWRGAYNGLCAGAGRNGLWAWGACASGCAPGGGGRAQRVVRGGGGGVFLLVYRLVESIYLLCLAVSRLKGV